MKYKGFEIKHAERMFRHGVMVKGFGIYRADICLTMASDVELAKLLINQRIRMGIWQDTETEEGAKES